MHSRRALIVLVTLLVGVGSQSSKSIVFSLREEEKADTLIGNVADESGLRSEVTSDNFDKLKYQILSSDGLRISSLFSINSHTGALFTIAMIDREQVCDSSALVCRLQFDVTVQLNVSVIKVINVAVIIVDINDNPPTFPTSSLQLSISEAAQRGSETPISGAIDKDAGLAATITYWIEDNTVFGLKEEKMLDGSVLKIVLLQNLDRETQSRYSFLIYAKDGNTSAALTGTLAVTVNVTDINDNSPQFSQRLFNFTVLETADVGSKVGTLNATDLDAGENGRVSYQFSSLTSGKVLQLFELNSETGDITVKAELLYESMGKFQVVVQAKDHGSPPRSSQANLVINVLDVGNTPPKLSLTLAEPYIKGGTLLSEDIPLGSFIGTLKYLDNDEGQDGVVVCESLNSFFDLQTIEDHGFSIVVKSQLDRESQSEITVVLRCIDGGSPSLSGFVNFTVLLLDVNDNSPVFGDSAYTTGITENIQQKSNIIQVSATDADEGINKELTYQLTTNSSNAFNIDPFTGWISLLSPVDREVASVIRLTVLAIDKGSPAQTGTGTVTVNVGDVNDNPPAIVRTAYQIKENQGPGAFVAQIVAADRDDGFNAQCSFKLMSDTAGAFVVSDTGAIMTAKMFDRETVDRYTISVSVTDAGEPPLSSSSTLTITVTDDNDNSPRILFPVPGNDTASVGANLSPGTVISQINAVDADTDNNAKLFYTIAEGNQQSLFSIDNTTGAVFVARRLTQFPNSEHRLTIYVQDGGTPRLHNETLLYVKIDFTNATVYGDEAAMDQKYVIMAGIIAGITLVIAIIIVAIILILRRTDVARCSHPAAKRKDAPHRGAPFQSEAVVKLHNIPGLVMVNSDKEAGFGEGKAKGRDPNTSFDSNKTSGSHQTFKQAPPMTHDSFDHPTFSLFTEMKQRSTSDDHHSDSSGDVTTSDSGKGASDVEEFGSGGTPPLTFYPTTVPNMSSAAAPRVPPREPVQLNMGQRPLHGHARESPNLPRNTRAYTSHADLDRTTTSKVPGKVRFSCDDDSSERPFSNMDHSRTFKPNQPNTFSGGERSAYMNQQQRVFPNFTGMVSPVPYQQERSHAPPCYDPRGQPTSPPGISVPLSRDVIARHDRIQGPGKQLQPLSPNGYPLVQHQPLYTHRHVPLTSLNHSLDEEDDDGSTTTSGSYAIEDNLNISVEC